MSEQTMYCETSGCTVHLNGERGVTTGLLTTVLRGTFGAFVRLDERPVMLHVELGAQVAVCDCGTSQETHNPLCAVFSGRKSHREVISVAEISRDQFDSLTGLSEIRWEMGWRP